MAHTRRTRLPTHIVISVCSAMARVPSISDNFLQCLRAREAEWELGTYATDKYRSSTDPVKEGLVPNLNRPGANATGVTFFTALLGAKRLGLLRDLVPGTELIALLVNQNSSQGEGQIKDVQEAARPL